MKRNQSGFNLIVGLLVLLILGAIGTVGWYVLSTNNSNRETPSMAVSEKVELSRYDVPSSASSPGFSTLFYKNAYIEKKSDNSYLISDTGGTKSSIWLLKVDDNVIPICDSGGTSFIVKVNGEQSESCYRKDRIIYTSEFNYKSRKYLISLVSQKPIAVSQAKTILGSVIVN